MNIDIRVPRLATPAASAHLVAWHRRAGEAVRRDEVLAELETDKVLLEIAAPADGELVEVRVDGGVAVTGGQILAVMAARDDRDAPEPPTPPEPVVVQDIRPTRRVPVAPVRRRIAENLLRAQRTQALVTTVNEVDMSAVEDMRTRYAERLGAKLGLLPFFVKAAVVALQRFPMMNAAIDGDDVVYHDFYDIGVAVATARGLMVPVVRAADRKGFTEIDRDIRAYSARAREATITAGELTGGTFTITNGGAFGSLLSTPIVNSPQSAILGMHRLQDRPVVVDGAVAIRPMMYLAVTYDHRLVDGEAAIGFLGLVKDCLEQPYRLTEGS